MSESTIVWLSRAARMEYDAGRRDLPLVDGQRLALLDDARKLRLQAGQSASVIESTQQHNLDRGKRGMA